MTNATFGLQIPKPEPVPQQSPLVSTLGILVASAYSTDATSWQGVAKRVLTFPPLLALAPTLLLAPVNYPTWLDGTRLRLSCNLGAFSP